MQNQEIYFLTCADELYSSGQRRIENLLTNNLKIKKENQKHISLEIDFDTTDFFKKNLSIASSNVSRGYCIWKPYFILQTLNQMKLNDLLFYVDCSDSFSSNTISYCKLLANNNFDFVMSAWYQNSSKNKIGVCTKRECLIEMNVDNEHFRNSQMIEAGFLCVKNCNKSVDIVNEWLNYCKKERCMLNETISDVKNYDEFKFNRYDQSVLSVLFEKHSLTKLKNIPGLIFDNMRPNQ